MPLSFSSKCTDLHKSGSGCIKNRYMPENSLLHCGGEGDRGANYYDTCFAEIMPFILKITFK